MAIRLRIRRSGVVRALLVGAVAAITLGASATASAYVVKKTSYGDPIHWSDTALTYHLDSSVSDATNGAAAAITAAASGWSGLEGAPALSIVQGGGGASPGYDGLNTIFYAPGGSPLTGGAIAVTALTYDSTGKALDADIIIDGRFQFAVLPAGAVAASDAQPVSNEGALLGPASDAPFDFQHITAHELGHSLGLGDETTSNGSLMFLYSAPGAASPRAPETDDESGIASLYDTGTPSNGGCGGSAISPRTPTNASSRLAAAFIVGLVTWSLARRRRGAGSRALGLTVLALTTLALLPTERAAHSSPTETTSARSTSHSRARVTHLDVTTDASGLFTTRAHLATTACRSEACPPESAVTMYGGTLGDLHQEIGGVSLPSEGDEIDVDFDAATLEPRVVRR